MPRLFVEPEAESEMLEVIEAHPERFPIISGRTRRALLRRFPFGVFYILEPDRVAVTACLHGRRDPRRWQSRQR